MQTLTEILAGTSDAPDEAADLEPRGTTVALHCPECGFVNAEGANYCQKCGAYLSRPGGDRRADDDDLHGRRDRGDAAGRHRRGRRARTARRLVIRSGGGRAGESFTLDDERITIGRTPDAGVFLDDVTVSRNHALLVRRKDGLYIDDLGSLNGTYVNRRRIESHQLDDGDEIQIGKFKLSYLES